MRWRAKETARKKLCRQKKTASMSPEERSNRRAKETASVQLCREKKTASMSQEETANRRAKETARRQLYREKNRASQEANDKESIQEKSCDYNIAVGRKGPIQQARKHDQNEIMKVDNNPNACRVAVCVLCDRLIIGCEAIHKITGEKRPGA